MAKDDLPKISVIVPVYNAIPYLSKCVNSILNQTFQNFELLLIDDGSTDGSGKLCEVFEKEDHRVRVFHQINGGAGTARNTGLTNATGKYICFVDSNDWIEEDYLINFYNHPVDDTSLIIQNYLIDNGRSSSKRWQMKSISFIKENFGECFIDLDLLRNGVVCSKLYSAAIIKTNSIRFDTEVRYAEDCIFMLEYLQYISCIKYINYAGYHYMHYEDSASLSRKCNSFKSELKAFELLKSQLNKLVKSLDLNREVRRYINEWLGNFFLRPIQSFHRNDEQTRLGDRVKMYRESYRNSNIKYLSSIRNPSLSTYISITLYKYKLFILYDWYQQVSIFLKNKIKVKE